MIRVRTKSHTMDNKKTYLGDGVYAATDGYHVILTVENGVTVSEPIYLEPNVLHALAVFAASLKPTE